MRVNEVMSKDVETVSAAARATEARTLMQDSHVRHLVVTEGHRIVGVISDRDVEAMHGKVGLEDLIVADIMSANVVTVKPDTPIRKAANLMRGRSIGCVVVTDGDRIKGIVTASDLLELLGRGAEKPSPVGKRPTLNFKAPHKKRHHSYGVW